ncbi:MAG: hypothetical protein JSR76_08060 [Verrucomicrobia bacterium]|nr:hypothetical protein [Verrucomicrobiota bacterium]
MVRESTGVVALTTLTKGIEDRAKADLHWVSSFYTARDSRIGFGIVGSSHL